MISSAFDKMGTLSKLYGQPSCMQIFQKNVEFDDHAIHEYSLRKLLRVQSVISVTGYYLSVLWAYL